MKNIYLFFSILFLISCKNDNETEHYLDTEFYEQYYQNNISPAITLFKNETEKEIIYIQNFKNSKSKTDFNLVKSQWLVCAKAYAKARVYNFGLIKNNFYDTNIFNFPVKTTAIELNIEKKLIYDIDYFKGKSTVTKGIGAMEYLIYNNYNPNKAFELLTRNNHRIDYLLGLNQEVLRQANLIIDTWENGYKDVFINANGRLCSTNAKCLSLNQLINILDITKVTKIGKTAGFEKSDNLAPKNLEAFRSKSSLLLIKAMLDEVKYAYQESETNFSSIVNSIDDSGSISKEIKLKFDKIDQAIATFKDNLYDAILTNPNTIKPIYDALSELSILFSVDVTSTLSVTVLPTDNDGD